MPGQPNTDDCPLLDGGKYALFLRGGDDIDNIVQWARDNSDKGYALGCLATMNYLLCKDNKTPAERMNDAETIRNIATPKEWIELYIKTYCHELLSRPKETIPPCLCKAKSYCT